MSTNLTSFQENDAEEITNKLDGLKSAEKDRLKKIKDIKTQSEKWQKEIDNPPDLDDVQAINDEMVHLLLPNL